MTQSERRATSEAVLACVRELLEALASYNGHGVLSDEERDELARARRAIDVLDDAPEGR